jgi:perosamine synthetase
MSELTRRTLLGTAAAAAALKPSFAKPALLGGPKTRTTPWPSWPVFGRIEEDALLSTLRSGKWNRNSGKVVAGFERDYAAMTGAKHCLATANGTSALIISLAALGVGIGDEVIVPPYTFVATVNAVLMHGAIPIFVDSDRDTFQIDARKIEAAMTDRTVAILPVHLGGNAADLDAILQLAARRGIPVVEDTCQAHLAEWNGRKLGTFGTTGCFSFQASKNLNCGDGGAILSNDGDLIEKCFAFHTNSRRRRHAGYDFTYASRGANLRMTEFQGAILAAQMTRVQEQSRLRQENGRYLTSLLNEIPGITPARQYPRCTANAYHLYMFRYDPRKFSGLSRTQFLKALAAEGVPADSGYTPLNKEPFLLNTFQSRGFARILSKGDIDKWRERNQCPENDRLCEEAVWLGQTMLLTGHSSMDQIAEAIHKIQAHAGDLSRT